jgi:uncharacterized protein YqcC (DUF446 family)
MLVSLRYRFIFVANLKTGSTAIEAVLRPHADLAITHSALGKHDGLAAIESRLPFVFDTMPRPEFLIFGAMRDPLDLLLSLYRSHSKPEFRDEPTYTGGMSLDEFIAEWLPANAWQWEPQWTRFRNKDGDFDCDFLMDFARLDEHFQLALALLGLPEMPLPVENESPLGPSADALSPALAERIRASRAHDAALLRDFGGRLRRVPPGLGNAT